MVRRPPYADRPSSNNHYQLGRHPCSVDVGARAFPLVVKFFPYVVFVYVMFLCSLVHVSQPTGPARFNQSVQLL